MILDTQKHSLYWSSWFAGYLWLDNRRDCKEVFGSKLKLQLDLKNLSSRLPLSTINLLILKQYQYLMAYFINHLRPGGGYRIARCVHCMVALSFRVQESFCVKLPPHCNRQVWWMSGRRLSRWVNKYLWFKQTAARFGVDKFGMANDLSLALLKTV